jgi:hypothetical protein
MTNLVATETQTPPNLRLNVGTHISQAIFPTAHFTYSVVFLYSSRFAR